MGSRHTGRPNVGKRSPAYGRGVRQGRKAADRVLDQHKGGQNTEESSW